MAILKVGVWLPSGYRPEEGGGYSYFDMLVEQVDQYVFDKQIEICFLSLSEFSGTRFEKPLIILKDEFRIPFFLKVLRKISGIIPLIGRKCRGWIDTWMLEKKNEKFVEQLYQEEVDLIYYPLQFQRVIKDFPFIATNWDLGHITTFAFPEVAMHGIHEDREHFYKNILPQAFCIFVESEAGKSELVNYLNIPGGKIKIVSLFPGRVVTEDVPIKVRMEKLAGLGLADQKFFFYPAQYWAHKNHYGLLCAFKIVHDQYPNLKLVFCGSDKGNLHYIRNIIEELQLKESVLVLSFVENSLVYSLYKHALALVMPTYIGPTNMPLLEALALDCPVLCSDFPGHRELLGDAAMYFFPESDEGIAAAMLKFTEQQFRDQMLERANRRKERNHYDASITVRQIEENLKEIIPVRKCWGANYPLK